MTGTVVDKLAYITVAVGFDRHTSDLVRMGAELAQKTGRKLCLMHAVEPWTELPQARAFGEHDPLWDVTQAVETNAQDLAEGRLKELCSQLADDLPVKRLVVKGKAAERLGAEAMAVGSHLLLVGADFTNARFLPRGLSTALSLMVSSPVPVGVVDTSITRSLLGAPTRVLLADDLGPQSEGALEYAFALAASLGDSELHHVHVNGLTLESLRAGLSTAAATAHTPINPAAAAEDVYEALIAGVRTKLDQRSLASRDYLEAAGGRYVTEVVTGSVNDQIATVAAAVDPHLVVFGRHHAYYTRPFFIGRVPFRSMLALRRPVIVVPNE